MQIFDAARLRETVSAVDLIDAMRDAFIAVSERRVRYTFSLLDLDAGDVHVKAAGEVGGGSYIVKVAASVPSNRDRGLPTAGGAIMLCSADSAAPVALLVDEHHLTNARTAAAGALATDVLAAPGASTVAVLGSGIQARAQVLTLATLRPLSRVVVWARRSDAAAATARDLELALPNVGVATEPSARAAVESSEIVVTTTASKEPLVHEGWLAPGHHVTALGADDDTERELTSGCFETADLIVVDSREQTVATAELAQAVAEQAVDASQPTELGEILAGRAPGRSRPEQITIAKLTGLAAQDLAAAKVACARLGLIP
ncbi:MAG: ornithine cyclodeaminase family protein [Solirubrobacteraceae bacterium]